MYRKAKRKLIKIINKINRDFGDSFVKTAIVAVSATTTYLVSDNVFVSLGAGAAIAVLLFGWDSRLFVAGALIFLLACPFWLAYGRNDIAEQLAIYAYFMMAVGIILHIINYAKEIFLAKKKKIIAIKNPWQKFSPARIAIVGLMAAVVCSAAVSGGGAYLVYSKMQNNLAAELAAAQNVPTVTVSAIQEVAGEKIKNQQSFASADWETINVHIRNSSGILGLEAKIADDFMRLGCKNVTSTSSDDLIYQSTLLRYCPSCLNVAQELLAALESPTDVLFVEDSGLSDEIAVILGSDQLPAEPAAGVTSTTSTVDGIIASFDAKNSV